MIKIALLGYGKMGKSIEQIALERGHEVVLRIGHDNLNELNEESIKSADVAIEFSNPESAFQNISFCLNHGVPVVSGTTGWLENLEKTEALCTQKNGSFLYASNFSIGVNIFFELNKKLASLMKNHQEYEVSMEEIHHTQKKDAPSGTAISLAEHIIETSDHKKNWVNGPVEKSDELSIISKRIDEVPGTHSVTYSSSIDEIEIVHTAHNRKGFAQGAVLAAEYIWNKKGIFKMKNVLDL